MNVKITNFLLVLLFIMTICSSSEAWMPSSAKEDAAASGTFGVSADKTSITFQSGFDNPLDKNVMISHSMLFALLTNTNTNASKENIYDVNINAVRNCRILEAEGSGVLILLQEQEKEQSFEKLLTYLQESKIKLIVNVTDAKQKESFNFLVEEIKLTPVPAYLLPENQKPVSAGDKFNLSVVIYLIIGIVFVAATTYGYVQYKGPADVEDEL